MRTFETNRDWLFALQNTGPRQAEAIEALRDRLFRGLLAYLGGQRSDLATRAQAELEHLADEITQEALLVILDKLSTFRGESNFTTWAYKIAVHHAISTLRRKRWQDLSLDALTESNELDFSTWAEASVTAHPESLVERKAIWDRIQKVIDEELTERQRQALIAIQVRGLPLSEVAKQLNTNPNNVYKIVHDARQKLKKRLASEGLTSDYIMSVFREAA